MLVATTGEVITSQVYEKFVSTSGENNLNVFSRRLKDVPGEIKEN